MASIKDIEQVTAINGIATTLSRFRTLPEITKKTISLAMEACQVECGAIYLCQNSTLRLYFHLGLPEELATQSKEIDLKPWITNKIIAWDDVERDIGGRLAESAREKGLRSWISLPLKIRSSLVGFLALGSRDPDHFTQVEKEALQAMTPHVAMSIKNGVLHEDTKARLEESKILKEVSKAASSTFDLNQLLKDVAQALKRTMGFEYLAIVLLDETTKELYLGAGNKSQPEHAEGLRLKLGEGITGWVALKGVPALVPDVSKDPRYFCMDERIRSELCVPLIVRDKTIGVLNVESDKPAAFSEHHLRILSTIACQVAPTIENARLYAEQKKRLKAMIALHQTALEISSQLELPRLLESIVERAVHLIDAQGGGLYLYHAAEQELELIVNYNIPKHDLGTKVKLGEGLSGSVVQSGEAMMVDDYGEWEGRLRTLDDVHLTAAIAAPLKWGNGVIGAILVTDIRKRRRFDNDDLNLLSLLASQAAVAIKNAGLFETEHKRATQLAMINEVGKKAISILDPDQMLDEVAHSICNAFNYHHVALLLVDWDRNEAVMKAFAGDLERLIPKEYRQPLDVGIIGGVVKSGKTKLSNDVSKDPEYDNGPADAVLTKSELCVPIKVGAKVIGVINVESTHPNAFDEADVTAMEALCGQVAVAIENARLFQAEQKRRHQVETLHQAAQALSTTVDLQQVLELILSELQQVVPYDSASVQLLKEGHLEIIGGRGFSDLEDLLEVSLPLDDETPNKHVVTARAPLILDDAPTLYPGFKREPHAQAGTRSWLGVPLLFGDRLIGMLALDRREPGSYKEEDTRLAMAFATQAAIAIENAKAFQDMKDLNLQTITALAAAVEAKDPYTSGHSINVTEKAMAIAQKMGLPPEAVENLRMAGLLHDIGKIGIPDSVLNKPGRLTTAEFMMIKAHAELSAQILEKIEPLKGAVPAIRHHHEWHNGAGYPVGLKGEDIPLLARILSIADGFDAMTSDRPYRPARSLEETVEILKKGAGSQWDPQIVDIFLSKVLQ